jgi:hypothetical protein
MFKSFTFWLIVLAMLIAYLCFSMERRRRAEEASWLVREREERERRLAELKHTSGVSFDVSAIAPQIQRLRQNHLAALHHRPHEAYYRRGMLAAFRQTVTNLAYFHHEGPEHEMLKHDASQF